MMRALITTILVLAMIAWIAGYGWFVYTVQTIRPHALQDRADAIVVLTGSDGRIMEGLNLFAAGRAETMFITSVHPNIRVKDVQAKWQGKSPLPRCCIVLDSTALTTAQNIIAFKRWSQGRGIKTIRLVTSSYHMPRAVRDAQRFLPTITVQPHPVETMQYSPLKQAFWVITFDEFNKYLLRSAQAYLPINMQKALP